MERYNNDEQDRLGTQGGVPIVMSEEGRYVVDVDSATKGFTVVTS